MRGVSRREFLSMSAAGGLSIAGLTVLAVGRESGSVAEAAGTSPASLTIGAATTTMVDGTKVPAWSYAPTAVLPVPGPILWAVEGEQVEIAVKNTLPAPHSFTIPGVVDSGPIAPGASVVVRFAAPLAASYLYIDIVGAPVGRVMGLQGAFIVMPASGNSPYAPPSPAVRLLFDDLGDPAQLGGDPWDPARQYIWLFNDVDPRLAARVAAGQQFGPAAFVSQFAPRYFTINGQSGFFAAEAVGTEIHGRIGQPALIRTMNAGMATHSPHIHGNHVYVLSDDGVPNENVPHRDTWRLAPLGRRDVLLPFSIPPDAYPWPPSDPINFPMRYPMHCHTEMSQTAGGGSYPQGAITHWEIEGV